MAYRVVIFPEQSLGVVELRDVVTSEEIATALHSMFGHESWQARGYALWDAREATALRIDPEGLSHIADWKDVYREERMGGRSAVLVRDEVDAEMALLIGRYRETSGRDVTIVRSMIDALQFLGLDALPPASRGTETASSEALET